MNGFKPALSIERAYLILQQALTKAFSYLVVQPHPYKDCLLTAWIATILYPSIFSNHCFIGQEIAFDFWEFVVTYWA